MEATKVRSETKKISSWVDNKKTGAYVLTKLKFGKDPAAVLGSSKLETLTKYVSEFNAKFPDEQTSVLSILTTRYGDDAVAKAMVAAHKDPTTPNALMTDHYTLWLKNSPYDAVTSPLVKFFDEYVSHFNAKFPKDKSSVAEILTKRYGDDALTRALVTIRAGGTNTEGAINTRMADKLWAEQHSAWLNSDKSIDDVFKLLHIGYKYDTWVDTAQKMQGLNAYVQLYNREKSGHDTFIKALSKGYGGDSELVLALQSARNVEYAEAIGGYAITKLQTELFGHWLNQHLDPMRLVVKVAKEEKKRLPPNVLSQYKEYYNKNSVFPSEAQPRRS
ncbi:RxLR effector protein [Phytophthora megakarya]|uniref:RxLR effector protein n=1 Tax=Phytophthora megakarya TaxID=4795 RepID=A0A225V414_9STRA|nr:RxLR effector protein [Phytophthora megakarya]